MAVDKSKKSLGSGHLKYNVAETWSICPFLRIGCLGLAVDLNHRHENKYSTIIRRRSNHQTCL